MNTVEKGNNFEDEAFDFIQNYVNSGNTWLNPKLCTFHKKKPYYSKNRESNIIVDISIECFLNIENRKNYSQLVVIECKNYAHPIPVDDIEEFESKLRQIAGVNIKGMFFSKSSYQKGAFNIAKNTGMALVRMLPEQQIEWVLERKPISSSYIERQKEDSLISLKALSENNYIGKTQNVFSYINETTTSLFIKKFNKLIFTDSPLEKNLTQEKLPTYKNTQAGTLNYLGFDELETQTLLLLQKSNNNAPIVPVNFLNIISYMKENYDIEFIFTEDLGCSNTKEEILGIMDTRNNIIKITSQLKFDSHRWRFTLAHEIGHYILHSDFIEKQYDVYNELESNYSYNINQDMKNSIINRLEWQANMFSNCILMPKNDVLKVIKELVKELKISNFSNGIIYLDNQPCNIHNYNFIISKLKKIFNVSATIATIRLKQLRILNDVRTSTIKTSSLIQNIRKTRL